MLLHQLKHVNIGLDDSKKVISMLTTKIVRDNQESLKMQIFLQALLDENPARSTSELASVLNIDRTTVTKCLHNMGEIHKEGK